MEALLRTSATSGHTVLISGLTVLIAMSGMFFSGSEIFTSFAVGTMIMVAVAILGSITVLPAMLSMLGDRVNKGRIKFCTAATPRSARRRCGATCSSACYGGLPSRRRSRRRS